MADSIDRNAFFDAFREFIPTANAFETRIYVDRIEVHRFARGEDGKALHDHKGNLYHTVETYALTPAPPADGAVDNASSDHSD